MSIMPRSVRLSRRMRDESRRRILVGSLRTFAEKGFHAASMSDVAAAAGVSKGLAYTHFRSKSDLLGAALDDRLEHLLASTEALEDYPSPRRRLAALIDQLIAKVRADPAVFRLYFSLTLQQPTPDLRKAFARVQDRVAQYLAGVERLFTDLGSPRPELDALLFRCALLGICLRIARSSEELPVRRLRRRLLELFAH